jgi:hypothetical protein
MSEADRPDIQTQQHRAMPTPYFARYAVRLAEAEAEASAFMTEVRAAETYLRTQCGYSLNSFAECTGVHRNSLLRLKDPAWLPEPDTLWRLDQVIVRAGAKRRGETFPGETIKRGRPRNGEVRQRTEPK